MPKINNRIEVLRKHLGLTLEAFGEKIGITRAAVSNIEKGRSNPSEQVIMSICREFDVNEQWLRTGEGEMLVKLTPSEELAIFTAQLQKEDSFRRRFVAALSTLEPEDWVKIQEFVDKLANKTTNPE